MPGYPLYSSKLRVTAPSLNALFAEIRNTAARRVRLREMIFTTETAVAAGGSLGVYRATNVPTGGTTQALQPLDAVDSASGVQLVNGTWTTAPTVGAIPLDGDFVVATIGGKTILIWMPGEELVLAASGVAAASLVLKAETALPAMTVKIKTTE